ncbi:hypothetical protein HMPREF1326_02031 [Akkermansia sp. KLE1605]|nr:hypothetical protein HMPREF1326_02031 [Akkermansia sp. KLE1605]
MKNTLSERGRLDLRLSDKNCRPYRKSHSGGAAFPGIFPTSRQWMLE